MANVLELDNICVDRRNDRVLDGVSLALQKGEFVALIGANGSGKTTLLRSILGFLRPASGQVRLFDTPVGRGRMARKNIGYVPQSLSIDFKMPMSVHDVVFMGRYGLIAPGRRPGKADRAAVNKAIVDVGLAALAERPIGHLSGGELQKVQIARALCQSPELLLLDEPTSSLDLGAQRECLDLVGRLHQEHSLTTLIVMHDLKSLPASCTRALILDNSRIVFDGPFADAFTEENLSHVYKRQGPAILRELLANTASGRRAI
ncbi:MAG: metal ABC transporter ATP-binding protein [Verrucomicrobiota bacterium]